MLRDGAPVGDVDESDTEPHRQIGRLDADMMAPPVVSKYMFNLVARSSMRSRVERNDGQYGSVSIPITKAGMFGTPHVPKCFNVMGVIGVGKTCLTESAKKEGYVTFTEQVNGTLLSDYITNPTGLAFAFQISMMQAACTRTRDACAMVADSRNVDLKGVVVERPAQENVFFAVANFEQKNMSDKELADYHRYIGDFATKSNEDFAFTQGKTFTVMPWAPEQMTLKRTIERNRLSEDLYEDGYINELFHSYFEGYLEILMINNLIGLPFDNASVPMDVYAKAKSEYASTKWKTLHVPFLVDWTNFGKWKDVENLVGDQDDFLWQMSFGKVHLSCPSQETVDLVDAQGYVVCMINDDDVDNEKPLVINLSWYYEHRKTHRTVASKIRDAFFRARIHKRDVILMFKPSEYAVYFGGPKYYK